MSRQTSPAGLTITIESAAALTLNRAVAIQTSGLGLAASTDGVVDGVVVAIGGETAAPYTATVQLNGIAQVESDGAGAIDEGDYLAIGATAGQVKTRARADGATVRYFLGRALSPAAATAGLLVDVLIAPFTVGNT